MDLLNSISKEGLVDPSLMGIIFKADLEDGVWEDTGGYLNSRHLPITAYNVCLFYFGLIQSYLFAKAEACPCRLEELALSPKIVAPISQMWLGTNHSDFAGTEALLSYFLDCAKNAPNEIFGSGTLDAINRVRESFQAFLRVKRPPTDLLSPDAFMDLLHNLPLLQRISLNTETMQLIICDGDELLRIKTSPFFSFLEMDESGSYTPVDRVTEHCYVLTAVSPGDRNNELYFDARRLYAKVGRTSTDTKPKRLCRSVIGNEHLALAVKASGISTQWYSAEDYLCNYVFLEKLLDVTETVLKIAFNFNGLDRDEKHYNILPNLCDLFRHTELDDCCCGLSSMQFQQLRGFLLNLFLDKGLFKTVLSILYNPTAEGKRYDGLFATFKKEFIKSGLVDADNCNAYARQCEADITSSLKKLGRIVRPDSKAYRIRASEIRAERQTACLLNMAGLQKEKLFADMETIPSIDDYYDKLFLPSADTDRDLRQVLAFLSAYYDTLRKNKIPFDEDKFYKDLTKSRSKYDPDTQSLLDLFDSFQQVVGRCRESETVAGLLGRKEQWDLVSEKIQNFKSRFEEDLSDVSEEEYHPKKDKVFISYSHKDAEYVIPYVKALEDAGLDVFFDTRKMKTGDIWDEIAIKAMESSKLVLVFVTDNALCSPAVRQEVVCAKDLAKSRFDKARQSQFILSVIFGDTWPDPTYDGDTQRILEKSRFHSVLPDRTLAHSIAKHGAMDLVTKVLDQIKELYSTDGALVEQRIFTPKVNTIANFYAYLKFGNPWTWQSDCADFEKMFHQEPTSITECIFPMVVSLKETRIKRDNIALMGYEMLHGKGQSKTQQRYILSSKNLNVEEYYCIPNYRNDNQSTWMIEPLLTQCDQVIEALQLREKD